MGKDAVAAQIGELAHLGDLLDGLAQVLLGLKADAAHAGIHLDVAGHRDPGVLCLLLQLSGVFQREHRLGDVVLAQLLGLVGRGGAQNQDGVIDALGAQRHRLVEIGHRKPVDPQPHQLVRNIFVSVPVGVRLDHAHNHTARSELCLDGTNVVIDAVQVHNCPAAAQKINHFLLLPFLFHAQIVLWFLAQAAKNPIFSCRFKARCLRHIL